MAGGLVVGGAAYILGDFQLTEGKEEKGYFLHLSAHLGPQDLLGNIGINLLSTPGTIKLAKKVFSTSVIFEPNSKHKFLAVVPAESR